MKELVFPIIRHGVGALGAMLVTNGYIDADLVDGFVGAGAFLIALAWSILEKRMAKA
jgi:hypothetical protein